MALVYLLRAGLVERKGCLAELVDAPDLESGTRKGV